MSLPGLPPLLKRTLFYTAAGKSMHVIRILHAARDFPTIFN